MVLAIAEDQTLWLREVMLNKFFMIAIYAVPTVFFLIGAYLFTKKR